MLLDAQVVIRQVSFGADGKVLASLRRFHGLDLGQLHAWKKRNEAQISWWRGTCAGFTTDAKTKSRPTDVDNVLLNRFFLLRNLKIFDDLVDESEKVTLA